MITITLKRKTMFIKRVNFFLDATGLDYGGSHRNYNIYKDLCMRCYFIHPILWLYS